MAMALKDGLDVAHKLMTEEPDTDEAQLDMMDWVGSLMKKLNKDVSIIDPNMTTDEVRMLVDIYYQLQGDRKATANRKRSADQGVDDQPPIVIQWLVTQYGMLEKYIKNQLGKYAETNPTGQWAMSIPGIGPVVAAGLIAHIDMAKAKTPGHIWSFAGLDPRTKWYGDNDAKALLKELEIKKADYESCAKIGAHIKRSPDFLWNFTCNGKSGPRKPSMTHLLSAVKARPWCTPFKTLCWKIGESFVKVKNKPDDLYGKLYDKRKAVEHEKNAAGAYAEQAARILESTPSHAQAAIYKEGRLPDGHIHSRAKRWVVKIFLSHYWEVAYYHQHGVKAPFEPYTIAHLGHAHKIEVPNFPWK